MSPPGTRCHRGGDSHPATAPPWEGDRYQETKSRLAQYVREKPEGAALSKVVQDVSDGDTTAGDAKYQLARRFFKRHPRLFRYDDRGDLTWIIPELEAFTELNLRQQYAQRKTSVREGDATTDIQTGDKTGKLYAKGKVNQYLERYLTVDSDSVKQSLFGQLATGIETTADRWQIFRDADDYLCLPYRTRHNDAGRARDIRDGFRDALETAGDDYNDAVMLTLTTDPKQHDGLHAALESLSDNKGRLVQWLSTDYQLGHRPTNLTALEFTRSGIPHMHLVLFGIDWAISQRQLSRKWEDLGQGSIVDIRKATCRGESNQWLLHDDESGKESLRQYLGKAIRELQSIANSDPSDLRDRVDSGDIRPWRQVLYWATEKQYFTCSPTLRETDSDSDDLPTVTRWEFIGTALYSDIPAHIRDKATFRMHPPP